MFLALKRLFWALLPLPRDPFERDMVLMTRAGEVLDRHHDGTRPTLRGIKIAQKILKRHGLPVHALRSMTRERDSERIGQARKAEKEIAAENAERDKIAHEMARQNEERRRSRP